MRTTLTIDPDVAKKIEQERHRTRRSLKQIINDALRLGLSASARGSELGRAGRERYRVEARRCGFRPGVDPERLNQMLDQLDADQFASKAAERGAEYPKGER